MNGLKYVIYCRAFCSLSVKHMYEYIHFQEAVAVKNGVVSGKKLKREGEVVVDNCNIIERCF